VLITVRAHENRSFGAIKQKLMSGRLRCPPNPRCLAHMLLDGMIDRYLAIREPMDKRLTQLQDQLLSEGQSNPRDWRELLSHRREARRLEALCEDQLEALDGWRRNSRIEWHEHETVRVRDLQEHIQRVLDHASNLEHDIESAVQLHFATVSHRTNEIIQTLTVLSAIFFPLTLLTGIWGMNFENMPELKTKYGYFFALGTLVTVAACLLTLFKKRKFF
jgi:magnesium/cobalt transport protein CorA